MRALSLVLLFAGLTSFSQAQTSKIPVLTGIKTVAGKYYPFLKTTTDTLNVAVLADSLTLYGSPNGGFMSGNSGYGEYAKVQEFDIDSACGVEGFVFWFGRKALNSQPIDSSRVVLAWYDMDSVTTQPDSGRLMPKTRLNSDTVFLADIDTSSLFDGSVYLWQPGSALAIRNFAAGLIFDLMDSQDTLALWSSFDGNYGKQTWEYYLNAWTPMYYNWGIDVRFSVLALIDRYAGLSNEGLSGLALYPNPGSTNFNLDLPRPILDGGVLMLDQHGRIALECRAKESPTSRILMDSGSLATGSYVCLVMEKGTPIWAARWVKQ